MRAILGPKMQTLSVLERRLNLGCGKHIRSGWVNLVVVKIPGVDVVHDITQLPLPFPNNEFDWISCKDILEHIEYIPVLKDLHRVLKPGGRLEIRMPHFTSKDSFSDPTHRKLFTVQTFRYFVLGHHREYYIDFHFSRLDRVHLCFETIGNSIQP